jgi:hypothetical protein
MFPWKSPMNKISGYSPLTAGAQWIDTEESGFFRDCSTASGRGGNVSLEITHEQD